MTLLLNESPRSREKVPRHLVLRVILPFAAGFFLSNYYRAVNAVLSPHLIADLGLSAAQLGLITSVYFFTSAVFQAPLGLFMDRYGPRRVQVALTAFAAIGVLIFALSSEVGLLVLGRTIMGIGASCALMTSFQAIVLWFPPARWPALNGLVMASGGLGALTATMPTQLILRVTDWHGLMLGATVATLAVSLVLFFVAPDKRAEGVNTSVGEQLRGLGFIFRDRLFWKLAPLGATTSGAGLAFNGLWSGPWLKDVAGFGSDRIALGLLLLTSIATVGFVTIGGIANFLVARGFKLTQITAAGVLLSMIFQLPLLLPTGIGSWAVLCGMGAFAGMAALNYPVLNAHFPAALAGRVNTATNFFVFLGAFFLQYAVGALIDLFTPVAPGSYPVLAYQTAFGFMLAIELVSWIWYLVPLRTRS